MDTNDFGGDRPKKKRRHDSFAYSVDEAADLIGVSRRTLYELIAERRCQEAQWKRRRKERQRRIAENEAKWKVRLANVRPERLELPTTWFEATKVNVST